MAIKHIRRLTATGLVLGGVLIVVGSMVRADSLSPYSDFQTMTAADLATLQVKLTYVGPQQEPTATVAFTSPSNTVNIALFAPFYRPQFNYTNDNNSVRTFSASVGELQAAIQNVASLPNVTAGGASGDLLSFALLNTSGGTKVFEAVLNKADTSDLMAQLRLALQSNPIGLSVLADMGCAIDVKEPGVPTDATSQVAVSISGVRLNRTTGRFVATAALTNNGAALSGPVSLVLDVANGVTLFNVNGTTCATTPVGRSYINIPLTNNTLPNGGTVSLTLEFVNPNNQPIKVSTMLLAGPGAR